MLSKDYGKVIKTQIINKIRVKNIENLCDLPKPGESLHIVTQKNITRHTFTEWILKHHKIIDNLTIATYRFSIKNTKVLKKYIDDGAVKKVRVLISQNYKMLLKDKAPEFEQIIKDSNIDFGIAYLHAKVTLFKADENYYVLTGSGNYSENDHIEEYQMYNDKGLYEFHERWVKDGK